MSDLPVGLTPDLRSGGELVRERVRGVRVLVEVDVPVGLREPARLAMEEAGRIVVLIADGGERYLSTPLWEM